MCVSVDPPCSIHTNCTSCLEDPSERCAWCKSNSTCIDTTAPNQQQCDDLQQASCNGSYPLCVFERECASRYRYNSFDRQINARTLRRVRVVSSVIRAAGAWATSFNTVLRAMHQHRLIPPNATRGSMRTARVRSGSVAWASDREDLTIVHMCVRACVLALQCVTNSMSASRVRLTRPTNRARMPRSSQGSTASGANGPTSTS